MNYVNLLKACNMGKCQKKYAFETQCGAQLCNENQVNIVDIKLVYLVL